MLLCSLFLVDRTGRHVSAPPVRLHVCLIFSTSTVSFLLYFPYFSHHLTSSILPPIYFSHLSLIVFPSLQLLFLCSSSSSCLFILSAAHFVMDWFWLKQYFFFFLAFSARSKNYCPGKHFISLKSKWIWNIALKFRKFCLFSKQEFFYKY